MVFANCIVVIKSLVTLHNENDLQRQDCTQMSQFPSNDIIIYHFFLPNLETTNRLGNCFLRQDYAIKRYHVRRK